MHGWSEFVPAAPCTTDAELSRFYQRQGGYLALLYALNACDFHCENLIAAGEHPVLIDLEALFHPSLEHTATQQAGEIARAFLGSSVMSVGLLPLRRWSSEEHSGIDLGGLSNSAGQLSPHPVPRWERVDSDEMHMVRKRVELTGSDNCPTLNGQQVNALDYADPIASGFVFTYRLLLTHRAELHSLLQHFADDEVRVIVRPTKTYAALYRESFHPDVLRNSADRSALFDRLQETVAWRPALERLIPSERGDLLRGDLPLFTTRPASRHLRTSTMQHIDNYFDESGMSLVERRLSEFSEIDLERQLWIVRASMTTLATHNDGPNVQAPHPGSCAQAVLAPEKLISAATTIADHLATLALGNEEEVTWTGLVIAGLNQWSVSPLGTDLYDGLPGVILFLAYLTAVSGNPRYGSMAKAALKTLRRQTKDLQDAKAIGVFTGWGGIAYLLAHLGVIWADSSLFLEAENMVNSISSLVERDQVLDIIGGAAGCILALLALNRCQPSVRTLGAARACGEHLLRTAQPTEHGIAWQCGSLTTPLTGFAHGNAGIAYALLALTDATGEKRFQQAGTEALAYERSLYSPEHRNWPDLRKNAAGQFVSAWCHGAPGIGLSRISALRYWKDSFIEQEIEAALSTTWAEGLGNNHALCHGDLGNGDILLHASEVLHERRWRACADQIAASALARANATGWVCANPLGVESPGFMTGLAGIGYALLRLANPTRVPSMLALEPPVLS